MVEIGPWPFLRGGWGNSDGSRSETWSREKAGSSAMAGRSGPLATCGSVGGVSIGFSVRLKMKASMGEASCEGGAKVQELEGLEVIDTGDGTSPGWRRHVY